MVTVTSAEIVELGKADSLMAQILTEIRDVDIQRDPLRFRRNRERGGEICAFEISKRLAWNQSR